MKSLAVFCGAYSGNQPIYTQFAKQMAQSLHNANLSLVYGGAQVGLMGTIADTMLALGSKVIGVMPDKLVANELAHTKLTQQYVVHSMHERKMLMSQLSDGFIMMPGGAGSLDEFFEIFTWAQLGFHQKPCGILNCGKYYDGLLKFLDHAVNEGFLKAIFRDILIIEEDPEKLVQRFVNYQAPRETRWK